MRPFRRTPPRWWVLGPSAVVVVVSLAILTTRWGAIAASQPAYLVTLLVVGLASAVGVGVGAWWPGWSGCRRHSCSWPH